MTLDALSTACAMRDALKAGEMSAPELVELHADRIERFNPALNAIVIESVAQARQEAGSADPASPLAGLPVTIKDIFDVAGLPNTVGGAAMPEDCVVDRDARSVARLRDAGAVVLGKTNSPPYAGDWQTTNEVYGRTNNPWNLDVTPGGSTGGGAAAVAAGLSPLELGRDIGGSIRIPAAFCGIYGHKPSETLIAKSGSFFSSRPNPAVVLTVQGPLARWPARPRTWNWRWSISQAPTWVKTLLGGWNSRQHGMNVSTDFALRFPRCKTGCRSMTALSRPGRRLTRLAARPAPR